MRPLLYRNIEYPWHQARAHEDHRRKYICNYQIGSIELASERVSNLRGSNVMGKETSIHCVIITFLSSALRG